MSDMIIGASFSHRHLSYLHIDPLQAIHAYTELALPWIRLGCYWNEIEHTQGVYNFHIIEELLIFCDKHHINVVLTVGMKAPRYPEYYIPSWTNGDPNDLATQNACLAFLTATIKTLAHHSSLVVWQIENEPRDPSGPQNYSIPEELLLKEIALVKLNDPTRKIMVTFWGNDLIKRDYYRELVDLVDIIGLDYYLRQPVKIFGTYYRYTGPRDSKEQIRRVINEIKSLGKEVWIAELQAEPWEPQEIHTSKDNPPSCLPEHLLSNFMYGKALHPDAILFWGFEWWYERKLKSNTRYWDGIKQLT